MLRDVIEVEPLAGHRLRLRFDDGTTGEVDVASLVEWTGVFEPLRERAEFERAYVDSELGTVCWPGGADLDPQVLYSAVTEQAIEFAREAVA